MTRGIHVDNQEKSIYYWQSEKKTSLYYRYWNAFALQCNLTISSICNFDSVGQ